MMRSRVALVLAAAAAGLLAAGAARADVRLAQSAWSPPIPGPPPGMAGPRVILNVDNPAARLQVQSAQLRWRDVCVAPCGAPVDPSALYRVGGGSSLASEPFRLPRSSGDVDIDAHVRSKVKHWIGLAMMIAGVAYLGSGVVFWQFHRDAENGSGNVSNMSRNFALVCFGVGGALEIVGTTMFLPSTSVQVR